MHQARYQHLSRVCLFSHWAAEDRGTERCSDLPRVTDSVRVTDMPRVYIGRLSYNVREKDIQRFFSGYGRLLEIDLKNG